MRPRFVLPLLAALAALLLAGCGGSGGGGGGDEAAKLAPADAPVFIEATIQPEGELRSDVEALAQKVAGVDDLGSLIVSEAEKAADRSGEPLDYEKEIQPWLGSQAGLYLESYDGDEFHGYGVALAVTDTGAAEEFIEKQAETDSGEAFESGSYEGVEYKIDPSDETVVGLVGEFLAIAEDLKSFKAMVTASNGESLADSDKYAEARSGAPSGSLADVYVDIGGLIQQSGGAIDPEARQFLDTVGLDPKQATALASLVPGSDQVEIDLSSNLSGENPPSGDASKLLGELPASSVAAIASAEFGKRFNEAVDQIDADGIEGQIPPHELKKTMKAAGIDLEKIGASVGSLGIFATGSTEANLGGAAVFEVEDASEAKNTVANVGLLLRASHTPGVTALSGKFTGFSVRSDELGSQPLVVAAAGDRIAVAYGLRAATAALAEGGAATLSSDPTYKEAVSALGGTPISGFVAGPAALRLATALIPADKKEGFDQAKPYLRKIDYVAIGGGASGDRSTAKLIVGVGK
ncbi:MAG TPA: DUF3352 domain-containing protein [Solirubrobacterales bacterium]|nr:DUF3352 domain-containing protein [Solirubrobacterales bacterium]